MKYLAAAIVLVALMAGDFLSHVPALHMSNNQQSVWAQWDTIGLIGFVILLAFGARRD